MATETLPAFTTEGAWFVNPENARVEVKGRDAPICLMLWPTELRSAESTFANASLIALAPEMLEALVWILENDDTGPTQFVTHADGPSQAIGNAVGKFGERARAVLAKLGAAA